MPPPAKTGCLARSVITFGVILIIGLLWHSLRAQSEYQLRQFGGEVVYTRGERAALLGDRLKRLLGGARGEAAPRVVDRLFGKLEAVHFGRVADLRGTDPYALVTAILDAPHLRAILIDGVPLQDADLLRLMSAPALAELGLKNTEVTEAGVAAARAKRPDVVIKMLEIE